MVFGTLPLLGAVLLTVLAAVASLGCGGSGVRRRGGYHWPLLAVAAMNQDGLLGAGLALQEALKQLLVRPLLPEVILKDLKLQGRQRKNKTERGEAGEPRGGSGQLCAT